MRKVTKIFMCFIFLFFVEGLFSLDHSHSEFDYLLKKYVKNGRVNYKGIQTEKDKLENYLSSLSKVTVSEYNGFSKEQKLAFLINAYNAFTIKLILDNYPVKSIRKIGGLLQSPWKIEFFELLGAKRHLDWIEHSKLRVEFEEPRIHFAIVCASIGCPHLASFAFTPEKLETQLQTLAENFFKRKESNRYEPKENILYLSPIFDWFKQDFTKKGTLMEFVNLYMGNSIPKDAKIKFTYYDWNLNEQ